MSQINFLLRKILSINSPFLPISNIKTYRKYLKIKNLHTFQAFLNKFAPSSTRLSFHKPLEANLQNFSIKFYILNSVKQLKILVGPTSYSAKTSLVV